MTAQEVLKKYFGYETFRPLQEEIVDDILHGNDTLGLMTTGGGKSLCFQIPTLFWSEQFPEEGSLCLVVTPLIALMKDQVENLNRRNIRATAIYTGMSQDHQRVALDNCQFGPYRFLYVSPERLAGEEFRKRLAHLPIRLIAVDEAHCISQWGYDFRPSYLNIAQIREHIITPEGNHVPVLALTATATPEVVEDIQERLGFEKKNVKRQSFARKNLNYIVRYCRDTDSHQESDLRTKTDELKHIVERVKGSKIVYVRNRKHAEEIAKILGCSFYHAGLTSAERNQRQEAWKHSQETMICTNAFGMGVDKPDVRLVVHYDLPDTIEAYFQEAGRAGRDGEKAYCVLLYAPSDKTKARKRIRDNYPPREFVSQVYQKVCDYLQVGLGSGLGHTFAIHIDDLCRVMRLPILPTYSALHLIAQAGYIHFEDEQESKPRIRINIPVHELRQYQLPRAEEAFLQTLMRQYTGIFTDLQYLREDVNNPIGDNKTRVRDLLISLSQRGIITYIPATRACALTFAMERQEDVYLKKNIYEEREDRYAERLRAMVEYAEQTQFCREQILLSYFGEDDAEVCGTCDVCRYRKG